MQLRQEADSPSPVHRALAPRLGGCGRGLVATVVGAEPGPLPSGWPTTPDRSGTITPHVGLDCAAGSCARSESRRHSGTISSCPGMPRSALSCMAGWTAPGGWRRTSAGGATTGGADAPLPLYWVQGLGAADPKVVEKDWERLQVGGPKGAGG